MSTVGSTEDFAIGSDKTLHSLTSNATIVNTCEEINEENHNSSSQETSDGQHGECHETWWSIGVGGQKGLGIPLTHQSAKLTMTGNRVFHGRKEDVWDLTDSLAELYEHEHRLESISVYGQHSRLLDREVKSVNISDWIALDTGNGFIRVYSPEMSNFHNSQLVPCSLSTTVHKIGLQLGTSSTSLHVQLNGDIVRRLDPHELPLVIQNDYLAGLGFTNITRIQEEGAKEELAYLIKFYSGIYILFNPLTMV